MKKTLGFDALESRIALTAMPSMPDIEKLNAVYVSSHVEERRMIRPAPPTNLHVNPIKSHAILAIFPDAMVSISWTAPPYKNDLTYIIQVSDTKEGKNWTTIEKDVKSTSYHFNWQQVHGIYHGYVRVIAVNSNGIKSEPSLAVRYDINRPLR
jgi:hypothetical protein